MNFIQNNSSALLRRAWTPLVEQLRYNDRPHLRRPRPWHWEKTKLLRLTEPIYRPEVKVCERTVEATQVKDPKSEYNPFRDIIAREVREGFYKSSMVAIYHLNSTAMHEILRIKGMLFDNKFPMTILRNPSKIVLSTALEGTKFEPVLSLCQTHKIIGLCGSKDLKKLISLSKKMPTLVLIGVVMDDRLLNKRDFEQYATMSLDSARAELSFTLGSGARALSDTLNRGVSELSASLSTYESTLKGDSS